MPKRKKMEELPPKLQQEIVYNTEAMGLFYTMSTDQRQNVLDNVSQTNEKMNKLDR